MASLRRTPTGWQAIIRRKGYPSKSKVFPKKALAEAWARKIEEEVSKNLHVNSLASQTTLESLLTKYKEEGEMAAAGQPLYKMADMKELILRAYLSGSQLSSVKTGGSVTVRFDEEQGMEECTGVVSWISPRAEFTPKIIQTREERVNLVYAIKVVVPNDGRLKIGMPGEVVF